MKTTYFLLKVTDNGFESSVDGIETLTALELKQLNVEARSFIDADTLKVYIESNNNIPVGCTVSAQLLTESQT